jgi:RHS repeat-associated protein
MKKYLHTIALLLIVTNGFSQFSKEKLADDSKRIKRVATTLDTIGIAAKNSYVEPAPTFKMPPLNPEVGLTEGQLNVSLTGSAIYNIPIAVPPGINGVVPQVALTYNSQGGNGIAGYGWNISGLSSITKVASTKFHDGVIDAVDFDALDRYAFDGQRLMLKSGTVYGAAGTVYETENFSNVKITAVGTHPSGANFGPASFLIEYPDGSIANYSTITPTDWAITYWQNAQGVRINYFYNLADNNLNISKITYGATFATAGINEINFVYPTANRQSIEEMYIGGLLFRNSKILESINVKGDNGISFRSYALIHNLTSLKYQRLASITEKCGDGTLSLNPTTFNYTDTADLINYNNTTTTLATGSGVELRNSATVAADYDGDGKMDFALYPTYRPNTNKWFSIFTNIDGSSANIGYTQNLTTAFVSIFPTNYITFQNKLSRQDGLTIIQPETTFGSFKITNYIYGPVNIFPQNSKTVNLGNPNVRFASGDFNGDGLTDLVSLSTTSVNFINLDMRDTIEKYTSVGLIDIITPVNIKTGDVNGDGKTDLMMFYEGVVNVFSLNQNNQLELILSYGDLDVTLSTYRTILLGDFNGDGKTDFLVPYQHNSTKWYKFISTGATYIKTYYYWSNVYYSVPDTNLAYYTFVTNDFDNDGKTDLLQISAITNPNNPNYGKVYVKCMPNKDGNITGGTGNSYFTESGYQLSLNKWALPIFYSSTKANRKLEVGFIMNNTIHYFNSIKDFNDDKLLKTITNGNGVVEAITYKPLIEDAANNNNNNNPNVYFPEGNYIENYPNTDIVVSPTFQVVKKLERISSELDSYKKQFFSYYGAVSNVEGLGFLGFRGTMRTNWHTGLAPFYLISNVSKNDIGLRGANIENYSALNYYKPNQTLCSWCGYVSKDKTTYNTDNATAVVTPPLLLVNKVFKLYANKTENFNGLLNTSAITQTSYDAYNNPTQATTNIKNGTVVDKTNVSTLTYENLNVVGSTYIIGRPLTKTESGTIYPTLADQDVFNSAEWFTYTNNLLTRIRKKGNSTQSIYEFNEYDVFGNITKKTISASGALNRASVISGGNDTLPGEEVGPLVPRVTSFVYNPAAPFNGRFLTASNDVEGLTTNYSYNTANGTLISLTNPFNLTTSFEYDKWFKKTKETDYLGKSKNIAYARDGANTKISVTSSTGGDAPTEELFDSLGRKIKSGSKNINDTWVYVSSLYNLNDQAVKTSEPFLGTSATQWNETVFDNYGRATSIKSFTGKETTINYLNLTVETSDGIKTQSSTSSAFGKVVSTTDTPGGTITNKYFANGNLKSSSYDNGGTTTITQDNWGRKTSLTDPSAGVFSYSYNLYGELLKEINPNGSTTFKYDNFGKVLSKRVSGLNGDSSLTTNTYNDATDKLLSTTTFIDYASGLTTNYVFNYDQFKRPNFSEESGGIAYFQRATQFDDFGRPLNDYYAAINVANNSQRSDKWVNYTYKNGYQFQIKDGINGTGTTLWQTDTVNVRYQLLTATLGNGVTVVNQYDSFGRPTQIKHDKTTTNIMTLNNTFDQVRGLLFSRDNNLFGAGSNLWSENFSTRYDSNDRLTSYKDQTATYVNQSYNANGNINTNNVGVYEYNNTIPAKPFQASAFTPATPTLLTFYQNREQNVLYNAVKKPIRISDNNQEIIDFDYNLNGQRSTMFYGDSNANKMARPFLKSYSVDGSMEIRKNNVTNTIEFITYIGGDAYSAPALLKTDGTVSTLQNYLYLHRDYQGSILAITDGTGAVKEKRLFDAWGSLIKYWNATSSNLPTIEGQMLIDRGYTGHEHLIGVGLINMNGRLYDFALHRFLSPDNNLQDPSNTQNYNRYGYVLNNPLNNTDPSGEDCIECPNYPNTNFNSLNSVPYDPRGKESSDRWIRENWRSFKQGWNKNVNSLNGWADKNLKSIGNNWDSFKNWAGYNTNEKQAPAAAIPISAPAQVGMFDRRTSSLAIATMAYNNSSFVYATEASSLLLADDLTGWGVFDDPAIPIIFASASIVWVDYNRDAIAGSIAQTYDDVKTEFDPSGFKYVTYTKTRFDGKVYVGRSSGYESPDQIVRNRDAQHHVQGYGPAVLSTVLPATIIGGYRSRLLDQSYWATRGAEQFQIEKYRQQGISGNGINGISPNSKFVNKYLYWGSRLLDGF